MILGLLGGLGKLGVSARGALGKLSGLGRGARSLLSGTMVGGSLGGMAGNNWQFLSTLSGIGGALGQYRLQRAALSNGHIFGNIRELYGRSNMAAEASAMLSGAMDSYGRALMAGIRAGGVMGNYYGPVWERLSRGLDDYGADLHAMDFNALQRDYDYRAHRLASSMKLYNALLNNAFDIYEHGRNSAPGGGTWSRGRTAESGVV